VFLSIVTFNSTFLITWINLMLEFYSMQYEKLVPNVRHLIQRSI